MKTLLSVNRNSPQPHLWLRAVLSIAMFIICFAELSAQACYSCTSTGSVTDCACSDPIQYKRDSYCGYVVQYDPCGNCTHIYRHNCKDQRNCGQHKKIGVENGWKRVRQVPVGAPVQFYVNNLNFFKYQLDVGSDQVSIAPGDPGLIGKFIATLQSSGLAAGAPKENGVEFAEKAKGCPGVDRYTKQTATIETLKARLGTYFDSFSELYKKRTIEDCKMGELIGEFQHLIDTDPEPGMRIDPAAFVESRWESTYTGYLDTARMLVKHYKDHRSCADLLNRIGTDTARYKQLDSQIKAFVSALRSVYPFPDRDYQYNVPQVKDVDLLSFKINLGGRDSSRHVKLHLKNEEIVVPVKGGIRVDFSTGLLYNNFKLDSYALRDSLAYTDTSIIKRGAVLVKDKTQWDHFGVATMLHIYPRMLPNLSVFPSVGIGATTDLSYSLLGGISVIVGRTNRASINAGFSLNSVKTLSSANRVGAYVPSDYSVKTLREFRSGYYVSLTYNIALSSKSGSTQAASAKEEQ